MLWTNPPLSDLNQRSESWRGLSKAKPHKIWISLLHLGLRSATLTCIPLYHKMPPWCTIISHPLMRWLPSKALQSAGTQPSMERKSRDTRRNASLATGGTAALLWRMQFSNLTPSGFLLYLVDYEVLKLFMPSFPGILEHSEDLLLQTLH